MQLRLALHGEQVRATLAEEVETKPASTHPWAYLLQRVFAVAVLTCSLPSSPTPADMSSTPDELRELIPAPRSAITTRLLDGEALVRALADLRAST